MRTRSWQATDNQPVACLQVVGDSQLEVFPPVASGEDLLRQLRPLLCRKLEVFPPVPTSRRPTQQQKQALAPTQTRQAHSESVIST